MGDLTVTDGQPTQRRVAERRGVHVVCLRADSGRSQKIEDVMAEADKIEEKQLEADTAEIHKDAEADG